MNWYRSREAASRHCVERLDQRFYAVAPDVYGLLDRAEDAYGDSHESLAIIVKNLPKTVRIDNQTGDMIVAILRPGRGRAQCVTIMLRDSDFPFTPSAMRVDRCISNAQFLMDLANPPSEAPQGAMSRALEGAGLL